MFTHGLYNKQEVLKRLQRLLTYIENKLKHNQKDVLGWEPAVQFILSAYSDSPLYKEWHQYGEDFIKDELRRMFGTAEPPRERFRLVQYTEVLLTRLIAWVKADDNQRPGSVDLVQLISSDFLDKERVLAMNDLSDFLPFVVSQVPRRGPASVAHEPAQWVYTIQCLLHVVIIDWGHLRWSAVWRLRLEMALGGLLKQFLDMRDPPMETIQGGTWRVAVSSILQDADKMLGPPGRASASAALSPAPALSAGFGLAALAGPADLSDPADVRALAGSLHGCSVAGGESSDASQRPTCWTCGTPGHHKSDCPHLFLAEDRRAELLAWIQDVANNPSVRMAVFQMTDLSTKHRDMNRLIFGDSGWWAGKQGP